MSAPGLSSICYSKLEVKISGSPPPGNDTESIMAAEQICLCQVPDCHTLSQNSAFKGGPDRSSIHISSAAPS